MTGNTWAVSGSGATPGTISGLATASYAVGVVPANAGKDIDESAAVTQFSTAISINSLRFNSNTQPGNVSTPGSNLDDRHRWHPGDEQCG